MSELPNSAGAIPRDRWRVMLADDEAHARLLIKAVLRATDCDVVAEATNGDEAVALYRRHRPDLLLMDLNMPVRTGEEALRTILTEFPGARVIVLSSMTDRESVETCLELGAVNYLRKDTPHDEIRAAVNEALNAAAGGEGAP